MPLFIGPHSPSIQNVPPEQAADAAQGAGEWIKENQETISSCLHVVDSVGEGKLGDAFDNTMDCIEGINQDQEIEDPTGGEYY